ncbi:hypothetical protein EI555_005489, partial [Monodon monoceros]
PIREHCVITGRQEKAKPVFDPDNVEHWIKRVEKASEFAVSKAFSAGNSDLSRRLWNQIVDLETPEQIEDHDEVYAEAQELVNDWLDTKLKQELASDGDSDTEDTVSRIPPVPEANGHLKYDKFDDLCGYLEEEDESTTFQKFIDHLFHKDVVDSGILEDLGMNENQDKMWQKDPHLTMEMRHKQVKENRLRREKELERQRIEKTLKKSAFLEARYLVQEEKKRKALEAKKEEEEIQREMCQKRYFSAWHKLILDHRIKLGKAGTLSDWKLQLKVLRAWRNYTRSQKLGRETQAMENDLREENRKQQLATDYNRKQVLRHHFAEWQHWHRAEIQNRELAVTKEETRKKMNELLKAASLGKLSANVSSSISLLEEATAMEDPPRNGEAAAVPSLWEKPPLGTNGYVPSPHLGRPTKDILQVPLQNVPLDTSDTKPHKALEAEPSQQPGNKEKLRTSSQKAEPMCMGHFHNRHIFQQQLIEKQKKKLQEQQKTILELRENQRLAEARRAAGHADTQSCLLSNPREDERKRTCQVLPNSPVASPGTEGSRSDSRSSLSGPRRNPRQLMAPHPILKGRAVLPWKREQFSELNAQLKAQEEERRKREAEEKEAQLEKKREEKRLKKMKELEKQKRIKRNQQLEAIAKEHYESVLLRKKGLEPWKRLRMQSKQNLQYLTDLEEEVQTLCVRFLQKKIFRAWYNVVREARIDSQNKHKVAVEHSDRRILWITFQTWKKFAKFTKEERGKEERREQLRR